MSSNPQNPMNADSGEDTLRLIASLPAPAGLEDRVHKALRAAPRSGRVLAWPADSVPNRNAEPLDACRSGGRDCICCGGRRLGRVQPRAAGTSRQSHRHAATRAGFGRVWGSGGDSHAANAARTESQGASHPSEQRPLAGGPDRERGSKGARTLPAKKPIAAKKVGSAQPAASQPTPQPAVSR